MLKLIVIGHLGQDAKINDNNEVKFINFSIAENRKYKNKDGQDIEKTTWINCILRREAGASTKIADYLKKGTEVYIEGMPDVSTYQNKEGKTAVDFRCLVNQVQLLGGKKEEAGQQPAASSAPANTNEAPAITHPDNPNNDLPY